MVAKGRDSRDAALACRALRAVRHPVTAASFRQLHGPARSGARRLLFNGASLSDLPADPHLVINATELRTGSAFRFGTIESGSWRWGKLHSNAVKVADAVAASAAYPLFLPAFDETLTFAKGGELKPGPCRKLKLEHTGDLRNVGSSGRMRR
jgi:NTE family protein